MINKIDSDKKRNKTEQIVCELRKQFADKTLAPGSSLPSNRRLAEDFGVSLLTMQRALDRLRSEGFLRVENRRGTFVSPDPAGNTNYGIVFSLRPTGENNWSWSSFNTGILHGMIARNSSSNWKGRAYFGVDGHTDSEDYQKLVGDLDQGVLSGLIIIGYECIKDTPIVKNPRVPMLGILGIRPPIPEMDFFDINHFEVIDKGLEQLAAHGCKRIAVLAQSTNSPAYESEISARISKLAMTSNPHWIQSTSVQNPHWARNLMQLLFHPGQAERPDALLVTDDNLLASATLGIMASGIRVPEDLMVASTWNFPETVPPSLPILKVGFDLNEILDTCVGLLEQKNKGLNIPHITKIPVRVSNGIRDKQQLTL